MSSSPREYLQHMLAEAQYLADCSADVEQTEFFGDETLKRAFVRSIEIIGEAAKHVPEEFRSEHPELEWRAMAGLRDRLIHGISAWIMSWCGTLSSTRYQRCEISLKFCSPNLAIVEMRQEGSR